MKEMIKNCEKSKVKSRPKKTNCVFSKEPTIPTMKGKEKSEIKVKNEFKLDKKFGKIIKNVLNKKDKI